MVDVGLSQIIVKRLNRWHRSRSKPHGETDHFYRGIRMHYNTSYRVVAIFMSLFLLSIAGLLYFLPDALAGRPNIEILLIKIGWIVIVVIAVLAPLQAIRDFVIVNEEGLMKSDLFSRKTRLAWDEILYLQINLDKNEITFFSNAKTKLKMSLCYNGWQDFLELSAKHLNQMAYLQIAVTLAGIKSVKKKSAKNVAT